MRFIGIDIGGMSIKGAIVDERARQYRKSRKGMLRKNQWRDVTAHIYV